MGINVLVVYDWYSVCSNCGHGADPREDGHYTELGYEPKGGCGVKWDAIATGGYYGEDTYERVAAYHPNLPFVEWLP